MKIFSYKKRRFIERHFINSMRIVAFIPVVSLLLFGMSCKKLVQIPPPTSSITTSQVFADSADAEAAIRGIYSQMGYQSFGTNGNFTNGGATIIYGMSADELLPFTFDGQTSDLFTNRLLSVNAYSGYTWQFAFPYLYQANGIIEGVGSSSGLSPNLKKQLSAEAKFIRAFVNFYLVNSYGDIPLITSTDYKSNALASRKPVPLVYQSIISDLLDAQAALPSNYSTGAGERIRINQFAAMALLARVYLYLGRYAEAETQASNIIKNTGLYSLTGDPDGVFLKNSSEAILQWQINSSVNGSYFNSSSEGYAFIPGQPTNPPNYYLTSQLLNAFETGDLRKKEWIDSATYSGTTYYFPYKYKVGSGQQVPNGPVIQYHMVLRLAEQYLIRAEAEANLGDLGNAINDLNKIRNRAGLSNLSPSLLKAAVLAAVVQERRIELFAEWGHRWLDLKRTGQAHAVLSILPYKQPWKGDYQLLYPIPIGELQTDPNLTQNPGY